MSLPVTFHRIGKIYGVASAERRCGRLVKLRGEITWRKHLQRRRMTRHTLRRAKQPAAYKHRARAPVGEAVKPQEKRQRYTWRC